MSTKSLDFKKPLEASTKNQDEEEKETNSKTEFINVGDEGEKSVEKAQEEHEDDEEDKEDEDKSQSDLVESVVYSQAVASNEIVSAVAGTSIGVKEQNLKDNDFHLISSFYDEDENSEEELEPVGRKADDSQEDEVEKAKESGEDEEEDFLKSQSSTQRSTEKAKQESESEKPKKTLKFANLMPSKRFKKQHSNASMLNNEFSSEVSNFNSNEDDLMLDLADLLTVIEEVRDESAKQESNGDEKHFDLKQTVSTVLLSKKWNKFNQKEEAQSGNKKGKLPKVLKFQPTYRMEPLINIFKMEHIIKNKTQQTFEAILQKYAKYDTESTPKLLRCITEIIKQQVKSFKLDRYKVVVHVTFIKKLAGQSVHVISKTLWSNENDLRICIRYDAYSYYAIGLIFLAYHE